MTPHLFGLFCQFVFFNINFTLFPQVKQHSKGTKTNEKLVFVSYMDNKDEDVLYCKCHFVSNSWHRSIAEIISPSYTFLNDIDFPSRAKIRNWEAVIFFFPPIYLSLFLCTSGFVNVVMFSSVLLFLFQTKSGCFLLAIGTQVSFSCRKQRQL